MAWDVDRLVALTRDFPRIQIPLSVIRELDEPFWFGLGTSPTCQAVVEHARLIDAADLRFSHYSFLRGTGHGRHAPRRESRIAGLGDD